MKNASQEAECCPKFDPKLWDGKIIEWDNKRFIKDKVFTLFYMPINYGSAMSRLTKLAEDQKAQTADQLCLADSTSMWNMDLYLAVEKEIPGAENVKISGKFICKVYEGDFSKTGEWMKDFAAFALQEKYNISKQYSWYTTCPKCAKKYGKNYVVIIGKI